MTITFNGRSCTVDSSRISIVELFELKDVRMPEKVSVQLNGGILERSAFESTYVTDGDKFLNAGGKRHVRGRAAQLQAQAAAKEAS